MCGGIDNGNSNPLPGTMVTFCELANYLDTPAKCEIAISKSILITNLIPFLYNTVMTVLKYNCVVQGKTLYKTMLIVPKCKPHPSWKPDSFLA